MNPTSKTDCSPARPTEYTPADKMNTTQQILDWKDCFCKTTNKYTQGLYDKETYIDEIRYITERIEELVNREFVITINTTTMSVTFHDGVVKKLETTGCDGDCEDEMYVEHKDIGVFYYTNNSHRSWIQGQTPTYPDQPELDEVDGFVLCMRT